jgi:hypothetical protein
MPERDVTPAAVPPGKPETAAVPVPSAGPGRRFTPGDDAGCEFCGHPSLDRHCKVVCPHCGAVRDCSDP